MKASSSSRGALLLFVLASMPAHADQAACDKIWAANVSSEQLKVHMKVSGYDFMTDTARLYGVGDQSCAYLRDETASGQPAAVYREQYKGPTGSTDATIWISKSSGRLLREEQDGDIKGKGKGHISYTWVPKP